VCLSDAIFGFRARVCSAGSTKAIKIGIMISMTGPDAAIGRPAKDGYEMAAAKFNKDGGVYVKEFGKKIPLEISILDMETNPEKAIAERKHSINKALLLFAAPP